METKKKRKNYYVKKVRPKRVRFACMLDERVVQLIKMHYHTSDMLVAEHIERAIQEDIGIILPDPEPDSDSGG